MRPRIPFLLVTCVLALLGTATVWRLAAPRFATRPDRVAGAGRPAATVASRPSQLQSRETAPAQPPALPAALRNVAGSAPAPATVSAPDPDGLRLRNTERPFDDLARDDRALLLRNALIDTASRTPLAVPEALRAGPEAGAYIVQYRGPISPKSRAAVEALGVTHVSYIPNNAFLVKATAAQADRLRSEAPVEAVLPYEPYFKVEPGLLDRIVRNEPDDAHQTLNVILLPGETSAALTGLGAQVESEFRTPFGPGFVVQPAGASLASIARSPAVQGIEAFRRRQLLNDLTRSRLGISSGTNPPGAFTNTLGLTGTNVFININDTGVDSTHKDLEGRVTADLPSTLVDFDGHGTHVAATIAGSGALSATASNAPGSILPGADLRGMAPSAKLYALPIDLITGPLISDTYLQEAAATNYYVTLRGTNLPISNNSWGYIGAFEYTAASASYDAAVRDALPEVTGEQPVLYVFAAGNEGFGADDGQGGEPNTIRSPGTGKNVITVGALESPRNITNEIVYTDSDGALATNQVFLGETDTDNQVASFSSRGNVEPGIEGRFGRFKPDVVAPGSFTISARSKDWLDPRAFSSALVSRIQNQQAISGARNAYSLFVPKDAAEFRIRLLPNFQSPNPFPGLPMYLRFDSIPDTEDFVNTNNLIRVPPDDSMRAGDWFYSVGNFTPAIVGYDIQTVIVLTNAFGTYFDELKKLNDGLAPNYRFESGTSMAAPAVSGLLALFQEYFQRENRSTTPALLKALLINAARSAGSLYNLSPREFLNLQGWGVVSLTNALPAGEIGSTTGAVHAVQYASQTGTNALVTGQNRSWRVTVDPVAQDQILKFTLVWTDPPGNPNASVKLVNDLDLVVKNLDTGDTYVGNDIPFRSDFNSPHPPGAAFTNDFVNNVENILVRPPLGTNYQVIVSGRRINVNAVPGHPDGIAQDFALVASIENTSLTNTMTFTPERADLAVSVPLLLAPTNGLALLAQRVGANPERLGNAYGATNQWTFLAFTNLQIYTPESVGITNGSNVAFITFLPPNLGRPRNRQADIDLYVSTDPGLLTLTPGVVQSAYKSTKPGGTELVYFTNAPLGAIYYIGVKAEDQQASEFGFVVLSSNLPFDEDDENGNRIVRGMPFNMAIPDGSPDEPRAAYVFGVSTRSFDVQRVIATNTMAFDSTGDILSNLSHNDAFSVLNNHVLDPTGRGGYFISVYDDSGGGNTGFGSLMGRPTDGPGSLQDFVGDDSTGPWILSLIDNALTQTATNVSFTLLLEPKPSEDEYFFTTVAPGGVNYYFVDVPSNATNLTVLLTGISPAVPLFVALRRGDEPTTTTYDKAATISPPGGGVSIGTRDVPPLNPGRYYFGVFNPNAVPVNYGIAVDIDLDLAISNERSFGIPAPMLLSDTAKRTSGLYVGDDLEIAAIKVAVRIDHPRVSDLVLHLLSPQGTRLLLAENRGGPDGKAYGATPNQFRRIYTTFTDDANLARAPIKFGIAPFTNSAAVSDAANRIVASDSFEFATPGTYVAGQSVAPGWRVLAGEASIVRIPPGSTNRYDGSQYAALAPRGISSLSTNVSLASGALYRLRFGVGRFTASQAQGIQVWLNGSLIQELKSDALSPGWYSSSVLFGARQPVNLIEFRSPPPASGRIPFAIDGVILDEADPTYNSFYLPEEALKPLVGQRALGTWKLEITDTRSGPEPATATGTLHDWRLEMIFAQPAIDAVRLTNGVPWYGSVSGTDARYFYVEVPACATVASNTIAGDFASLVLFGDHDGLPVADLNRFQDDYGPFLNVESGGLARFTLTTNSPAPAPLRPGQRYYLAVRNFQPDLTDNPLGILVAFDCEDPLFPIVPSLTNDVPRRGRIDPGPILHYYQFIVSSNAIRTDFELTPNGGNVDLFIKRAEVTDETKLPSPSDWDYKSDDADPLVVDRVGVERLSVPVPLTPGLWYVGILNSDIVPVDYTIKATETYTTIVNLTNAVWYGSTIAAVNPDTGPIAADLQYYAFLVSSNSVSAVFETGNATGDVNLFVRRGLPIPTPYDFHFAGTNTGTLDEFISVANTTEPVWLTPGWWFLSVINNDVTNASYSIRATEYPGQVTPLTNNVPVTNSVSPGPEPAYYSFQVSPEALSAKFEVFGMSDDVQLLLRRGLPLPTFHDYTYASTNAGTADEVIELTPYSFPVGLTPGDWYLGVVNAGTNLASFVVRASEVTAPIVVLANGVPHNASIPAGATYDYYQFSVSTGASLAEFKLTSAGAGDLDLLLRKGPPLPDELNAHYFAMTVGAADEIIRVETNSLPVPLSPGIWYLSVTNRETFTIGYEITATEFGVEPPTESGLVTNVVLTTTNVCIAWVSIPGTNYFVLGKTNALDAAWIPISPTIRALDTSTTWCLAPPGPWRFFDVREGESPFVPIPDPVAVLRLDGTNVCVGWASVPGTSYFVQAKKVHSDPEWTTLTPGIVASGSFTELCYPIDWGYRFFDVGVGRVVSEGPVVLAPEVVEVRYTIDQVCVTWPTRPGLDYLVEGKRFETDPNWTVVSGALRGAGSPLTLCLDAATEFRLFQVIEGVSVPPGTPPSVPVPNVTLSVDAAFQLCLAWDTLVGAEYFVEAKERIADSAWTVISPIVRATSPSLSYCLPLGSNWRYYQVRRVNREPAAAPRIDGIEITPSGPRLRWTGSPGGRYQVFYSDEVPPVWKPAGGPVTAVTSPIEWTDDGSQTGGLANGYRLYRIELLP